MKTLVVYDSYFGNTKEIAKAIGGSFNAEECKIIHVYDFDKSDLDGLELLIVGSPTRGFQPTKAIKSFLNGFSKGSLTGIKVMAFDTRLDIKDIDNKFLNIMVNFFGYAAETIAKKLTAKGGELLKPAEWFFVRDSEGPLRNGETERAELWAKSI